jgi:hypothetical protein
MVEASGASGDSRIATVADIHRKLILWILGKKNSKVAAKCVLIGSGADDGGKSMEQYAIDYGVTRALFSKYCQEFIAEFRIPPSRAMMSTASAAKYKETNYRPAKKPNDY